MMTKTAFVTGGTGFLGLNLLEELVKHHWKMYVLYVPSADLTYLPQRNTTAVCGNLLDVDSLHAAIPDNVDVIFHMAANTSVWSKRNHQQYLDNVVGTQNLVNVALEKQAKRVIYTSSISAYGYHPGTIIDEGTPSNALTCTMNYNKTKYQAECVVKDAVRKGLNAVILNPCNILGPYDANNWARQLIRPIYHGKLAVIPPGNAMWCHVKDIVQAHIAAIEKGAVGENYLLGGTEARFIDVVNEIERLMGKTLSRRVQPRWVMKLLVVALSLKSALDGKEPLLTQEKYNRAVGDIRCNYEKAVRTLDYRTSPLSTMVSDTYTWLEQEGLL